MPSVSFNRLGNADIIAHNIMFDVHILQNELFRLGDARAMECAMKLEKMNNLGRTICTGELGKDLCQLEFKSRYGYATTSVFRPGQDAKRIKNKEVQNA